MKNNEIQTTWGFGGPKNLPYFERIIVVTFVMVTKKYYAIKQPKFGNTVDQKLFYIYVILHVNYLCQIRKIHECPNAY